MPFPSHRQSERIERESDESQAKFGAETSLQPLASRASLADDDDRSVFTLRLRESGKVHIRLVE